MNTYEKRLLSTGEDLMDVLLRCEPKQLEDYTFYNLEKGHYTIEKGSVNSNSLVAEFINPKRSERIQIKAHQKDIGLKPEEKVKRNQ
tara:strand:+ start:908 stop:1168 length:261 start_codon:yes stop_codon:yes gene_type:complete